MNENGGLSRKALKAKRSPRPGKRANLLSSQKKNWEKFPQVNVARAWALPLGGEGLYGGSQGRNERSCDSHVRVKGDIRWVD